MGLDSLYQDIKSKILTGDIPVQTSLVETTIAKKNNISRLHVKSVFQRLEAEQLLEHIDNKGYFVAILPETLYDEIIDIRQALESVIVKRVIEVATAEQLEEIQRSIKRITVFFTNNMIDDGLEEVTKFYDYLYAVSDYKRVVSILDTYSDYIRIIRKQSAVTYEAHMESLHNLQNMADAIVARNVVEAQKQVALRHKTLFTISDLVPWRATRALPFSQL